LKSRLFPIVDSAIRGYNIAMKTTSETRSIRPRNIVVAEADARRLRGLLASHADSALRDATHLSELESELERALLLSRDAIPADVVVMNSCVQVRDLASGKVHDYTLVYPAESNPSTGRISVLAPLGTALLGYREGDEVEWQTPGGVNRLRIENVRRPYEHPVRH
jgi:regulator of nucleoside diphosphate kinase